jgi:hypothetical protein
MVLRFGPWPRLPSEPPSLRPGSSEWRALACFAENRNRYGPGTWGWLAFGPGADVEAALRASELIPADAGEIEPLD